jgi:hypothetical protein
MIFLVPVASEVIGSVGFIMPFVIRGRPFLWVGAIRLRLRRLFGKRCVLRLFGLALFGMPSGNAFFRFGLFSLLLI